MANFATILGVSAPQAALAAAIAIAAATG